LRNGYAENHLLRFALQRALCRILSEVDSSCSAMTQHHPHYQRRWCCISSVDL